MLSCGGRSLTVIGHTCLVAGLNRFQEACKINISQKASYAKRVSRFLSVYRQMLQYSTILNYARNASFYILFNSLFILLFEAGLKY
jgi:hypothetical protein